jgi:SHAQKYF class myb-like DNA-binding protein
VPRKAKAKPSHRPNSRVILEVQMHTIPDSEAKAQALAMSENGMMRINEGRWTKSEHDKFLEAMRIFKKDWKQVARAIRTRTVVQVRTHAQKHFRKLAQVCFPRGAPPGSMHAMTSIARGSNNFSVSSSSSSSSNPLAQYDEDGRYVLLTVEAGHV